MPQLGRHGQGAPPVAQERPRAAVAAPWNSLANPSAVTAALPEAAQAVLAVLADRPLPSVRGCRVACASPWPPASSCSFRSRSGVQPLRLYGVLTPRPNPGKENRPLHRWHGRHLPRPHAVRASGLEQPQASDVLDVRTGMTAPSWKLCAAARRRSSARRFTSSGRTTTPWPLRPAAMPASSRTWCCRRVWRARPSQSHSSAPHPSRSPRCGSAGRKPPVNVSVVGPWNCGPPARPHRCGRRC